MDEGENVKKVIIVCLTCASFIALIGVMMTLLLSCTYNVSLVHTEGQASNVGDETADADPDISPHLSLPLTTP
jgi:hypothetical protein